jgi:cytoskeletal protein CcmA (bactofilin family)
MSYFDFEGKVKIDIKSMETKVESVVVRPLSLGIKPKIKGDTISFELDKPAKLTIEINGNIKRAIHIFANPMETDAPKKDDPNVIYFGPGIHNVGRIPVKSNQTVYISGGAVVYGCIKAENLENLKITGRGIIDGSIYDRWVDTTVPIDLRNCKNSIVEGIMLLDPAAWTLNIYECQNIELKDVKIISARSNSDGITIQSSRDITAANCFVRSWDDSLVVKGYGSDTKNIIFEDCILWTDLAQSCEIGYETRANTIEDITFRNITVLHNFHKPVLSIHNADNALVRNIHYENIVVEDAAMGMGDSQGYNYLIDLFIGSSQWSQTAERGSIRDVYFENIEVLGGQFQGSRIYGYDDRHTIENVNIKGLKILGEAIKDTDSGKFKINNFAEDIKFQ